MRVIFFLILICFSTSCSQKPLKYKSLSPQELAEVNTIDEEIDALKEEIQELRKTYKNGNLTKKGFDSFEISGQKESKENIRLLEIRDRIITLQERKRQIVGNKYPEKQ